MIYIPEFENTHCHTYISNILTKGRMPDSPTSIDDYAKVYARRGMKCVIASEHGYRSDVWAQSAACDKYGTKDNPLKPICAAEAYFCTNRLRDSKDEVIDPRTLHLLLIAKNNEGFYELNSILSEAYDSGYYYVGRLDFDLLSRINSNNFICTTACVGGPLSIEKASEDGEKILNTLHSIFRDNLRLEIQPHLIGKQVEHNKRVLEMYRKYNIPLILGTDSHYINKQDKILREELQLSARKNGAFDDEGWELHLPTAEEAYDNLVKQGVFSKAQIQEAFENTLEVREFDGFTYTTERKFPIAKQYLGMSEEEREKIYQKEVCTGYINRFGKPTAEEGKELRAEMNTILETHSADYFLGLKAMLDRGVELGGKLTTTGRGSASGFATNGALGFTTVNRLHAPVKMYPARFISKAKLQSGSLPDIDSNIGNLEPFERAGKEVFGENGCIPTVAFGKLKTLAAFKMLARARDISPALANIVSKQISKYELDVKHAKENNQDDPDYDVDEDVNIADYVDNQYMNLIEDSKTYQGIIVSVSPHPCAHITYHQDLRRLIGTIRIKDTTALFIDGATADAIGYCKSDLLRVDVVKIINNAFEMCGIPVPSADELINLVKNDPTVWQLYADGATLGLNQCEKEKSTERIMTLKPKNTVELTAFVAAIRPGAKSMVNDFINRIPHTYGIPAMDNLLKLNGATGVTGESSFLFYDEQIMTLAEAAGVDPADAQLLIKAIKKKKHDKVEHYKDEFIPGFIKYLKDKEHCDDEIAEVTAKDVWTVIMNSASYLFNASHAFCMCLDSLYGAYLKRYHTYEFYTTMLKNYDEKGNKEKIAKIIVEMKKFFGISLVNGKFGQDNTDWYIDKEAHTISQSLSSIKFINKQLAYELKEASTHKFETFTDLIRYLSINSSIDTRKFKILIAANYFSDFGPNEYLLRVLDNYYSGKNTLKNKNLVEKTVEKRMIALREEELMFEKTKLSVPEQLRFELNYMCMNLSVSTTLKKWFFVQEIDDKYGIKIKLYNINSGTIGNMKISKDMFAYKPLKKGDTIILTEWTKKQRFNYKDGTRTAVDGVYDLTMKDYSVFDQEESEWDICNIE